MSIFCGQEARTKQCGSTTETGPGEGIAMCENCEYWDYGDCDETGYYMDPDDWCRRWKEKNAKPKR